MPGLGWRPSRDDRNNNFPMRAALPATTSPDLITVKTWPFLGSPLDQGETGTCVAHAASHAIHCGPICHRGFIPPFPLYREIIVNDEYTDNDFEASPAVADADLQSGSSGLGAAKTLHKKGLIDGYLWGDSLPTAIAWLLTRGPIMVGANWYSSMSAPTREGMIKITPAGRYVGGHEWLWRGIDLRRGVGEGVQSWGPTWNANASGRWGTNFLRAGHFTFELEMLDRLFREGADVVSIIEKRKAA